MLIIYTVWEYFYHMNGKVFPVGNNPSFKKTKDGIEDSITYLLSVKIVCNYLSYSWV